LYVARCPRSTRRKGYAALLDIILVLDKITIVSLDPVLLSAIASPRRREILRLLWNEELSAGAINDAFPDVTFGAVSLQLRALTQAGLVSVRPEGRHRYYRVQRERLGPVGALLEQMWADALWRLKIQAEFETTRRGPRPRRKQETQ
jgi:DNA-binding transcriptional ArsR family regulator